MLTNTDRISQRYPCSLESPTHVTQSSNKVDRSATEATSHVQHVELAMMEAVRFDWQAAIMRGQRMR